jgi:hypothetical protein
LPACTCADSDRPMHPYNQSRWCSCRGFQDPAQLNGNQEGQFQRNLPNLSCPRNGKRSEVRGIRHELPVRVSYPLGASRLGRVLEWHRQPGYRPTRGRARSQERRARLQVPAGKLGPGSDPVFPCSLCPRGSRLRPPWWR